MVLLECNIAPWSFLFLLALKQTNKQINNHLQLVPRPQNGSTSYQSSHDLVRSIFFPPAFRFSNDIYFLFRFRKSKVIGPLHMSGPLCVSTDAQRIVTCVRDRLLLTDLATGSEICRFATVPIPQSVTLPLH